MCEARLTIEQADMLAKDLMRRKTAGKPKLTATQWLNQYKDCSHCKFQATCHRNPFQWVEEWGGTDSEEFRPKVNRSLTVGKYNACCKWDGEMTMSLMRSLEKAKERGEVIA